MSRSVSILLVLAAATGLSCTRASRAESSRRVAPTTAPPSAEVARHAVGDGPTLYPTPVTAPDAGTPVGERPASRVVLSLEIREVELPLADGATYTFWTYGGHVPGNFLRIRQGDQVEFHLKNHPDNKMPHNIDLHAVTGPGGGASSTFTAPGHETSFTFRALNPGLFVYHCATAPVGEHIANGMYGLILVEPPGGLPRVDREYYVMQGDLYTKAAYHARGLQAFDLDKAIDEKPTYVLFNGAEGALTGKHALHAKVGETVRIFVGNGGPNLTSSFHVIGEIFDRVYREGGTTVDENVQTTTIPPGGAAIVELTFEVPGTYTMVDHALFRAFNQGAMGQIVVDGYGDGSVYSGQQSDRVYTPDADGAAPAQPAAAATTDDGGQNLFANTCAACHQADGKGLAGQFPPLAGNAFVTGDADEVIRTVLGGKQGALTVDGSTYNGVMPPWAHLPDTDIAAILSYVRSSFGNDAPAVTAEDVARVRSGQ